MGSPAQRDAAPHGFKHSGDGADERGLACPVRADNGDDRAFGDLQRHVVERADVAIGHFEVFDGEHQSASAPR